MLRKLEFYVAALKPRSQQSNSCHLNQEIAGTRTFTVTGFSLPVAMVYSTATDIQARFPGIASNEAAARRFVQRLVMQTVIDVLESQGRSALLPDDVISSILGQLSVNTTYKPLSCQNVVLNLVNDMVNMQDSTTLLHR
ncbi:hypothetical protein KIN20_001337 [Parelaphostrongylus tenuis]|uniref:Uncharacterized protein n=1 Tax=Parelaphostrongylus tenuis TaxID=148309 RepID=A0AAD5QGW2_PARTN|nr:hypothetical protein KIN20_001337 [Parelaphostrongylus tenuis]